MAASRTGGRMSTDELMQLATELAGLSEAPLDSGVHVPGDGIRRVIFALDVNVGLLVLARAAGLRRRHRPPPVRHAVESGRGLPGALRARHALRAVRGRARAEFGPSLERTVRRLRNRRLRSIYYESPNQTFLEVDAARTLGIAFLNIHNACDELGRQIGQAQLDGSARRQPPRDRWAISSRRCTSYPRPASRHATTISPWSSPSASPAIQPNGRIRTRLPVRPRARHHALLLAPRYPRR